MKPVLKLVSYLGLALSVVPAFFLFHGAITAALYQGLIVAGMILWFGSAVFWIKPAGQTQESVQSD